MNFQATDKDITLFAKTNFRNREVPFGIRRDDRRRHMYIIGKTGMGKTTFIENMVVQDILNGHGVCFVDPHGDSVEKILQFIPSDRINDVIYLNPADIDFPIAFNPLEAVDARHKHLVASGLMGVFTKIWAGVWSSRMEYILNNTILALLDSPGNTMLGIARMYVDKVYRKKIVDNIKDPVVKSFWVDEYANYQDKFRTEAVAPIQNKVGQFLSNSIIRNIVGQTKSSIDLRDIMDNRKILLLNLAKGRIGEDSSALLGAMVITKLQLAAMSRVDTPEEERADFYLYVDEFQNFATESFASILSEARKYRLNLIVAHQYIGQLVQDRNTIVRDAIFGNVGTMITFRVGADDAEFLEKEYEPTYTMNDLVNLSKFSIYLKLMINGVASNPFSAGTLPPISEPTGNTEKVIKVSRERYATERDLVETKISKWLGAEFHTAAAIVESESVNGDGVEDELRFKHAPARPTGPTSAARPATPAPKPFAPASFVARQAFAPVAAPMPVVQATPSSEPANIAPAVIQPKTAPVQAPKPNPEPRPTLHTPHKTHEPVRPRPQPANNPVHSTKHHQDEHKDERRFKQTELHPGQRANDKPKVQQKHSNPIWETVSKLTTEKMHESVHKTNKAIETLSKSLHESVVKTPLTKKAVEVPEFKPAPVVPVQPPPQAFVPPPIATPPPIPTFEPIKLSEPPKSAPKIQTPKTFETIDQSELGHLSDPALPEGHVHPDDPSLSPHVNVQDVITRHNNLAPGEVIKFD